ncbi:MAG: carboxylating nicotinate-nucleotide diphosphorylase [Candidatus Limnocylindrales bacterium]
MTATETTPGQAPAAASGAPAACRQIRPPDPDAVARVVASALAEDLALGDPTTDGLFTPEATAVTSLLVKEPGLVCGLSIVAAVFSALNRDVTVAPAVADGDRIAAVPAELARVTGPTRAILSGERSALNLLGRLSGIATLTARCVAELDGTGATLLDTRKTTAGLRELEKYAVRCGGGTNHRLNLGEALLVKDNHLRLAGGIATAAARLRETAPRLRLEVEAETLDDVREALAARVNRILLDNMTIDELRRAVAIVGGRVETEASGGITLDNLHAIGATGVDFVSIGALTHSVKALDVSLEVAG